jgi:uncharacterized membrane protein YeiH
MPPFQVPPVIDYGACFLWALTGGLLAARRGHDVVGVVVVALVSSAGGGLLRDGLLLQDGPPLLVRTPDYLLLALLAALVVLVAGRRLQRLARFHEVVAVVDAVGLGAYAVVGALLAQRRELHPLGVVLTGVTTAVGGSVLRDLLLRQEPEIFRPGTLMAIAALGGCLLFLALTRGAALDERPAAWITIAATAAVRGASVYWNWRTRPVLDEPEPPAS